MVNDMKIICDCGNESEIKETNSFDEYGEVQLGNVKNFEITKGEYCIYITCSKCGKTICILV